LDNTGIILVRQGKKATLWYLEKIFEIFKDEIGHARARQDKL